jgi:hypothetical protein
MALIHDATLSPSKAEALAAWVPRQPWAAGLDGDLELMGAYRFDDPEGEVGLEGHLVRLGGVVLHAPLTYRAAPLAGAEASLVTEMHHSVLGTRYVYDGCADAAFLRMLAVMALTGVGQAAQVVLGESVVETAAPSVRLVGSGRADDWVEIAPFGRPVDSQDGAETVITTGDHALRVVRRPAVALAGVALQGGSCVAGTWEGQAEALVLAELG